MKLQNPRLLKLIRRAIGNPQFSAVKELSFELPKDNRGLTVYEISLPIEEFRGFPCDWLVVVIEFSLIAQQVRKDSFLEGIHNTTKYFDKRIFGRERRPILLISDSGQLNLSDEYAGVANVFCVNAQDLADPSRVIRPWRSPIANAIRRKMPNAHSIERAFWPYHSGAPSEGWRFYGRSRELNIIVESTDNILVLGSRRIGKTSLLHEARRRLENRGQKVVTINLQSVREMPQLVEAFLLVLEPKDRHGIRRRAAEFGEKPLDMILRRLANTWDKPTLLIDELGVVLHFIPEDSWKFFGLLRGYMHDDKIRVIASAFNEFSLSRQVFEVPHSNFASEIMLRAFDDHETEQFALGPWDFWGSNISKAERRAFIKIVKEQVGGHPLFLQEFGVGIFTEMQEHGTRDILKCAELAVRKNVEQHFGQSVRQVFFDFGPATPRYLFLKRSVEAREAGLDLHEVTFDDEWVKKTLSEELRLESDMEARRNLTEAMEMRGLCTPIQGQKRAKRLCAPIIMKYIEETEDADYLLREYAVDASRESQKWRLRSSVCNKGDE